MMPPDADQPALQIDTDRWLRDEIANGREADLSNRADRRIFAATLTELCHGPASVIGPISVRGGIVVGRIDLTDRVLSRAIRFTDCTFDDGIRMTRARASQPIEFVDCTMSAFEADRLESKVDVVVRHCQTSIDLRGAEIRGDLVLTDTILGHPAQANLTQVDPPSTATAAATAGRPNDIVFNGADVSVKGSICLDGVQAHGLVILASAHVGRDVDCRRARFHNPAAIAIDATRIDIGDELIGEEGFSVTGEFCLGWARTKAIRLAGATLAHPQGVALRADGIFVDTGMYLNRDFHAQGTVRLVGAHITGELACTCATFEAQCGKAIEAHRISAADVYFDRGFTANGGVFLTGAHIKRQLTCTGGRFTNPGGHALEADGLDCGGSVFLDRRCDDTGFIANGEVRLVGARIGAELTCTGGLFQCQSGVALNADGLTTEGNVYLDGGFRAIGIVRLARATIGRQLSCAGASLDGCGELALDLTGAVVHGDVELNDGFRSAGEVRLSGAAVDRNVDFTGATLARFGTTLAAHRLRAGSSIVWKLNEAPGGAVNFSYAEIGALADDKQSWPDAEHRYVVLEGLRFRTLDSDIGLDDRLAILNNTRIYSMQQYKELSRAYREVGKAKEARITAIAGHRQLRKRRLVPWYSLAWNWFLDVTVGYGYRLWLPGVFILVLGTGMGFAYDAAYSPDPNVSVMVPTQRDIHDSGSENLPSPPTTDHERLNRLEADYPAFYPWVYSFELLIPVVNLHQVQFWIPRADGFWSGILLFYTWIAVALGWIFGVALAAGLNHAIRRE